MENSNVTMNLNVESTPLTDPGKKRKNNEDWVAGFEPNDPEEIKNSGFLFLVADGVGGASRGEHASRYAAQKILFDYYQYPQIPPAERLTSIIRKTCKDIYQYSTENGTSRMATTLVAAVIRENKLTIANVGDSRGYLIRAGQIRQITRDHSLAEELVRNGSISAEEAKHSKIKNKLMRSLGGEADVDVDIFNNIQLYPGDLILLCTDGLTRYTMDEDLLRLSAEGTTEEIGKKMVAFANQSGGADNISIYLIEVKTAGEATSKVSKGIAPEPIDWETIQTQSNSYNIRNKRRKKNPAINSTFIYGIMGIITVAIIAGSALLINKYIQANTPVESTPFITPVAELTITSSATIEPTNLGVDTLLPSENFILTETFTPGPSTPVVNVCIHQIQAGEFISNVYIMFSIQPSSGEPFYKYGTCDIDQLKCSGPKQIIENIDNIPQGMLLEIPGISQQICTSVKNSYWVTISNP